jgi:quinol monooxygenase YgiN
VKSGTEDAFKAASLANARESALEPGIARFDVIQQVDDPTKFVLVEVYKNEDAPLAHKETQHYNTWRETVADMMAEPRSAVKYKNLFPSTSYGWDYSKDSKLEC